MLIEKDILIHTFSDQIIDNVAKTSDLFVNKVSKKIVIAKRKLDLVF